MKYLWIVMVFTVISTAKATDILLIRVVWQAWQILGVSCPKKYFYILDIINQDKDVVWASEFLL